MNRRELLQRTAAVGGGVMVGGGIAMIAAGIAAPGPKEFAVKLPKDAPMGSAVTLIRVQSGWIVVPYGCTAPKGET